MGKVTHRDLPEDHPKFKGRWLIATVKKDKNSSKNKNVVTSNKEGK